MELFFDLVDGPDLRGVDAALAGLSGRLLHSGSPARTGASRRSFTGATWTAGGNRRRDRTSPSWRSRCPAIGWKGPFPGQLSVTRRPRQIRKAICLSGSHSEYPKAHSTITCLTPSGGFSNTDSLSSIRNRGEGSSRDDRPAAVCGSGGSAVERGRPRPRASSPSGRGSLGDEAPAVVRIGSTRGPVGRSEALSPPPGDPAPRDERRPSKAQPVGPAHLCRATTPCGR